MLEDSGVDLAEELRRRPHWTWHRLHLDPARPAGLGTAVGTWGFVTAVFAVAATVIVVLRRRALREQAELESLERGLGE